MNLIGAIEYYQRDEAALWSVLNDLIESAAPKPGDIPAFTFGALCNVLHKNHERAVTVAALALMRLAELEAADR